MRLVKKINMKNKIRKNSPATRQGYNARLDESLAKER